ncbi:hypothetical protein GPECTOR_20g563 [Gonium pectorale]|uniref:UDP-glycosyltransferases domain-containing protein n=1 Tax=Gonium pectorale TaxID=33097 RepID=A0A150GIT8_GONPE|nr:hypothetical protein GPECTOR_20g563 [Gonium pectorale]|eukprot:KXZ49706.1 hypothetical protein GPECTOR_20g563 [Gonium pectorale]
MALLVLLLLTLHGQQCAVFAAAQQDSDNGLPHEASPRAAGAAAAAGAGRGLPRYRILVAPLAWRAHALPLLKVSHELASRGHDVTVLLPQYQERWARDTLPRFAHERLHPHHRYPHLDCHGGRECLSGEGGAAEATATEAEGARAPPEGLTLLPYDAWDMEGQADAVVDKPPLEQLVADSRFDVFFGDVANFCVPTLAEFWRLPRVDFEVGAMHAIGTYNMYGQPFQPAVTSSFLVPLPANTVFGIKDWIANMASTALLMVMHRQVLQPGAEAFQRSVNMSAFEEFLQPGHPAWAWQPACGGGGGAGGPGGCSAPTSAALLRQRLLLLIINLDWSIHNRRSMGPHIKMVGALTPGPPLPLPPALRAFMSPPSAPGETGDARNGTDPRVIYVSGGSVFCFGDPGEAHLLLALLSLPERYRIVWKIPAKKRERLAARLEAMGDPAAAEAAAELKRATAAAAAVPSASDPRSPPPPASASRLLLLEWAPQNDILAQPAVALFVSQCGANGMQEAGYYGVPLLCVPVVAEQPLNAAFVASHGMGRVLDRGLLNGPAGQQAARRALTEVLADEAFRRAARLVSARMRAHPRPAAARAADWVEYAAAAARAGPPGFLVPAEAQLPWWRLAMLDVWAPVGLATWAAAAALAACVRRRRADGKSMAAGDGRRAKAEQRPHAD